MKCLNREKRFFRNGMEISESAFCRLINCSEVPPETGGIIGGKKSVITDVVFDKGKPVNDLGIYTPDIDFINNEILKWNASHIEFYGMFHTHIEQWPTLSDDDKLYISQIMDVMPMTISCLLFPLVFPKSMIKWFKAYRFQHGIKITEIEVKINASIDIKGEKG